MRKQTISGSIFGINTQARGASASSNDVLDILGTVNGSIRTNQGDDVVTVGGSGAVNGNIFLGAGGGYA